MLEAEIYDDELILTPDGEYEGYNALVLNAFENSIYRTKFYEKFVDNWIDEGMDVDYDDDVTVSDMTSKLSNKDVIALSGHGMIFNGHSVFCLGDDIITTVKDTAYNLDL